MEKISTSLLVLLGVQQVVHLLSLMREDPILDTSGLEYHLLMSAIHLSLYLKVCTYVNAFHHKILYVRT